MRTVPHPSVLALAALLALALWPTSAEGQRRARLDAQVGASMTRLEGGSLMARPATRLQLSVEAEGPLEVGVYLQAIARELPLKSPAFGGGVAFAVRPRIPAARLRPLIQASAGYALLPDSQMRSHGGLDLGILAGLAVEVTELVAIEVRAGHHWLLGLPDAATLEHRHYSVSGGVSFTWD